MCQVFLQQLQFLKMQPALLAYHGQSADHDAIQALSCLVIRAEQSPCMREALEATEGPQAHGNIVLCKLGHARE